MAARRLVPLACVLLTACPVKIEGELTGTGPEFEGMRLTPDTCVSGEHEMFMGVYLFQESDKRLGVKVLEDPVQGPVVTVNIPATCTEGGNCQAAVFNPINCTKFDVQVTRNMNVEINGIHPMEGHVELDCARDGGSTVKGRVSFEKCR